MTLSAFNGKRGRFVLGLFIGITVLFIHYSLSQAEGDEQAPRSNPAKTYFVAPQGKDSNTGLSPETPWRTLARMRNASFNPGDTIRLKSGGIWHEPLIVPSNGAPNKPLTISSYGAGQKPLIDCTIDISLSSGASWKLWDQGGVFVLGPQLWTNQIFIRDERLEEVKDFKNLDEYTFLNRDGKLYIKLPLLNHPRDLALRAAVDANSALIKGKKHIVLQNLRLSGSRGVPGVLAILKSSDIAIESCEVSNSRGFGIALASSNSIIIDSCVVHDVGLTGIGASGDGEPSYDVQVRNNRIYRIGWLGMDRFNDGHGVGVGNLIGCHHWLIEGNNISECGRGGGEKYGDGGCGPAITAWETHDIVIRRNRIHDNFRGGITLELAGQSNGNNHEISYNLIFNNGRQKAGNRPSGTGWSGIGVYKFVGDFTLSNIRILHNVVTGNYLGFQGACSSGIYLTVAGQHPMTHVLVANNIVADNGETNYEYWRRTPKVHITLQNNLFNRNKEGIYLRNVDSVYSAQHFHEFLRAAACDDCFKLEPKFIDPEKGDFRLSPDSSAYARGVFIPGFHDASVTVDIDGRGLRQNQQPSPGAYHN